MKKWFLGVLLLVGVGVAVYDLKFRVEPCTRPIRYSIGSVDPRFGLDLQELREIMDGTEGVWENPMGRELFQYDPASRFKVNFIYDERQKRTDEEKEMRNRIDSTGTSYDGMVQQYDSLYADLKKRQADYEVRQAAFSKELAEYNQEVDYWNKRKDIPQAEYDRITKRKQRIEAERVRLERESSDLSASAEEVNGLADRINTLARKLNLDVEFYNGRFGKAKQFDQGVYTGSEINIYQFSDSTDLTMVLAHELGHALDLEHVDNPEAIMHYLMQKQDLKNIHATSADLEALKAKCGN